MLASAGQPGQKLRGELARRISERLASLSGPRYEFDQAFLFDCDGMRL